MNGWEGRCVFCWNCDRKLRSLSSAERGFLSWRTWRKKDGVGLTYLEEGVFESLKKWFVPACFETSPWRIGISQIAGVTLDDGRKDELERNLPDLTMVTTPLVNPPWMMMIYSQKLNVITFKTCWFASSFRSRFEMFHPEPSAAFLQSWTLWNRRCAWPWLFFPYVSPFQIFLFLQPLFVFFGFFVCDFCSLDLFSFCRKNSLFFVDSFQKSIRRRTVSGHRGGRSQHILCPIRTGSAFRGEARSAHRTLAMLCLCHLRRCQRPQKGKTQVIDWLIDWIMIWFCSC